MEDVPDEPEDFETIIVRKIKYKQINVGIVVGHLASEGTYTARRNVKHYIYSTVIPLR